MNVAKIRKESRERDRMFSEEDKGFGVGFVLGILAAALILFLWLAHRG